MHHLIFPTALEAAQAAATRINACITTRPTLTLGLATGATMLPVYDALTAGGGPDMRDVTTFNLDEYTGLAPNHPASYHHYMREALFARLAHPPRASHLPRGDAVDPAEEARRYEALIAQAGGIDLQLLGIGRNGHIGFNEPGSARESRTRVVALAASTLAANAGFFAIGETPPARAISMGIATILEARSCLMLATGAAKAPAVAQMLSGAQSSACPATYLTSHPNVTVLLDQDAASLLPAS